MSSGKSKTQTTTETVAPPAYIGRQLEFGVDEARRLYNQGTPGFFPGQTYAGFTPQQEQALNLTEQRALAGSPLTAEAQNQLGRTLRGEFLGANQYIDPMIAAANRSVTQQFAESVMPGVQSSLGRAGRYGSNAATQQLFTNAQRNLAQQLADTEANIRGNAYAQERQLMNAAIGQAPALAAQDFADLGRLAAVGEQRQAMNQHGINEQMARYQYENTIDQQALDQFLARVTGTAGSAGQTGTKVTPVAGSNTLGQVLGIAGTVGGFMVGGPAGAAIGGGLGSAIGGGMGGGAPVGGGNFSSMLSGYGQPTPYYNSNPMQTFSGGAYGGGFSPTSSGVINWYK